MVPYSLFDYLSAETTTRDCGPLTKPDNGAVSTQGGTAETSVAQYTCNEGYELCSGCQPTRTCNSDGRWSHTKPSCTGIAPIIGKM